MAGYIGFVILLLVVAFLAQVDFIYYIVYVCVGIFIWAYWVLPRMLVNVRITRHFPKRVFWNEPIKIRIKVENNNWVPFAWLQINESYALELTVGDSLNQVITMRAQQKAEYEYSLLAKRRGYYRIGPMRLSTGDLFGMDHMRHATVPADYLTVYPRIIGLHNLGLPSKLPFGTVASRQRLFEDPARPVGVREFRSGDSLRQINWKVTAHTRNLMVKTFQPAISLETMIVLNLHHDDYARQDRRAYIEWAIEIAASLAAHLVKIRQAVGLLTNGIDPLAFQSGDPNFEVEFDDGGRIKTNDPQLNNDLDQIPPIIAPRSGRQHLMKLLERLARIEASKVAEFDDWFPSAAHGLSWGTTVLMVTPRATTATTNGLHRMARAGLNPVLLICNPMAEDDFRKLRERGRRLGFRSYYVNAYADLNQWRQAQKR